MSSCINKICSSFLKNILCFWLVWYFWISLHKIFCIALLQYFIGLSLWKYIVFFRKATIWWLLSCCTSPAQYNSIAQMSGLFQFSNDIFIFLEQQTSPTFQPEQPSDQNVSYMFNASDLGPEKYRSQWWRVTQYSPPHLAASFQSLLRKPEATYFTRLLEDYFTGRELWCSEDSIVLSHMPVICHPTDHSTGGRWRTSAANHTMREDGLQPLLTNWNTSFIVVNTQ